jgi:hypothetical protein
MQPEKNGSAAASKIQLLSENILTDLLEYMI